MATYDYAIGVIGGGAEGLTVTAGAPRLRPVLPVVGRGARRPKSPNRRRTTLHSKSQEKCPLSRGAW